MASTAATSEEIVPAPLKSRTGGTLGVCISMDAVGALLACGLEKAGEPHPVNVNGTVNARTTSTLDRNALAEEKFKRTKPPLIVFYFFRTVKMWRGELLRHSGIFT